MNGHFCKASLMATCLAFVCCVTFLCALKASHPRRQSISSTDKSSIASIHHACVGPSKKPHLPREVDARLPRLIKTYTTLIGRFAPKCSKRFTGTPKCPLKNACLSQGPWSFLMFPGLPWLNTRLLSRLCVLGFVYIGVS